MNLISHQSTTPDKCPWKMIHCMAILRPSCGSIQIPFLPSNLCACLLLEHWLAPISSPLKQLSLKALRRSLVAVAMKCKESLHTAPNRLVNLTQELLYSQKSAVTKIPMKNMSTKPAGKRTHIEPNWNKYGQMLSCIKAH